MGFSQQIASREVERRKKAVDTRRQENLGGVMSKEEGPIKFGLDLDLGLGLNLGQNQIGLGSDLEFGLSLGPYDSGLGRRRCIGVGRQHNGAQIGVRVCSELGPTVGTELGVVVVVNVEAMVVPELRVNGDITTIRVCCDSFGCWCPRVEVRIRKREGLENLKLYWRINFPTLGPTPTDPLALIAIKVGFNPGGQYGITSIYTPGLGHIGLDHCSPSTFGLLTGPLLCSSFSSGLLSGPFFADRALGPREKAPLTAASSLPDHPPSLCSAYLPIEAKSSDLTTHNNDVINPPRASCRIFNRSKETVLGRAMNRKASLREGRTPATATPRGSCQARKLKRKAPAVE
uniref:Uncharacterized protein n=1 Tax=Ananas comosus var. bracteatus TaxID=296719 RepID=A0A6V7QCX9_ANACO|nr:unnamed protein product [Ananas comosus var. bracteatus]